MPGVRTFGDIRLGEGGLLRRFESACHVTKLAGQVVVVCAITWLPLVVGAVIQEWLSGAREPLLHDPAVHVRLLGATPLLLIADYVFPMICRRTIQQLLDQDFVRESEMPRFERMYRKSQRLSDAALPEVLLLVLAVGLGVATLFGLLPINGAIQRGGLTPTQMWYALLAGPVFQFLLWRSLWRWLIWVRIVVSLAWLDLRLVPTHPDRRGGLGFLSLPSVCYCAVLLFVASGVLSTEWAERYTFESTLATFKPLLLIFAVVGAAVAFGPLLFFTPRLIRLRLDSLIEYDALGAVEGREFSQTWVESGARKDLLPQPDVQSLASLGQVYRETVTRIHYVLFEKRDILVLLAATLLPVVPVMVLHVPRESWHDLLELISGSRLP